jgi:formate hydrogenlyase subunit 6/NADH:ubiquinone oxidoreductase subunit I
MKKPGKIIDLVLSSLFKRPATTKYPFVKSGMPKNFRGQIAFHQDRCIGCKMCMRDCPSNAITITKVGDKLFEAEFDLAKCIYCAQCVDSCPKAALEFTGRFELAALGRDKLKVTFHAEPEDESQKKA